MIYSRNALAVNHQVYPRNLSYGHYPRGSFHERIICQGASTLPKPHSLLSGACIEGVQSGSRNGNFDFLSPFGFHQMQGGMLRLSARGRCGTDQLCKLPAGARQEPRRRRVANGAGRQILKYYHSSPSCRRWHACRCEIELLPKLPVIRPDHHSTRISPIPVFLLRHKASNGSLNLTW